MRFIMKLGEEASNNAVAWDVITRITTVLEPMGIDVEEQWEEGECKLVFTQRAGGEA